MELEEILEHAKTSVERAWGDARPEPSVTVIGYTDDNEVIHIPLLFRNDEEKHRSLMMVTAIFACMDVKMYVTIAEAWMSRLSADNIPDIQPRPSKDPNKIEVVMLNAVSRNKVLGFTYEISDDKLLEHPLDDAISFGGRFSELLPPEGLSIPKEMRDKIIKNVMPRIRREKFKLIKGGKDGETFH